MELAARQSRKSKPVRLRTNRAIKFSVTDQGRNVSQHLSIVVIILVAIIVGCGHELDHHTARSEGYTADVA